MLIAGLYSTMPDYNGMVNDHQIRRENAIKDKRKKRKSRATNQSINQSINLSKENIHLTPCRERIREGPIYAASAVPRSLSRSIIISLPRLRFFFEKLWQILTKPVCGNDVQWLTSEAGSVAARRSSQQLGVGGTASSRQLAFGRRRSVNVISSPWRLNGRRPVQQDDGGASFPRCAVLFPAAVGGKT